MRKLHIFTAFILALITLLCACTPDSGITDTTNGATQPPVPVTTEPAETEVRVAKDGEIIPYTGKTALADSISGSFSQNYVQPVTTFDGTAAYRDSVGLGFTYTSTFYGADSAINRDYVAYGRNFIYKRFNDCPVIGSSYFIADFNGDNKGDFVSLENGKLVISYVSIKYKNKNTNVATDNCVYSVSSRKEFDVGEGAVLCGAGDINGDLYSDILFYADGYAIVYFGSGTGFTKTAYKLTALGTLYVGDVEGDGMCEIIDIDKYSVTAYYFDTDSFFAGVKTDIYMQTEYLSAAVGDINSDTRADILFMVKDGDIYKLVSLFGRGDGRFGPYEADNGNKNLYNTHELKAEPASYNFCVGDITGRGGAEPVLTMDYKKTVQVMLLFTADEPAYDYSLFGMKIGDKYYMYSGCRWYDENTTAVENGDGDHVILSTSDDGIHWKRHIDGPMFYLGWELGIDEWWSDNTLEPEVLYVDGVYHMYWQCSYTTPKGKYGDKIGYATSTDGINWTRKTDAPAILCDEPEVGFNHEEVIYVADDPDGKPYWMYTGHFVDGAFKGYIRIRSADPTKFLYTDREATGGFGQIGNQICYIKDADGNRVFMRITFTEITKDGVKRSVPTFQVSRDGLHFVSSSRMLLAGVDATNTDYADNKNVYFLGMVTENGTGEIKTNDDGSYTIIYLATTCATPVAPEIFLAEGGVGVVNFTIEPIS